MFSQSGIKPSKPMLPVLLLVATSMSPATASLDNWYVGAFDESCDTVCTAPDKPCLQAGREMLDSVVKMNNLLEHLGEVAPTCEVDITTDQQAEAGPSVSFWYGGGTDPPSYHCFHWATNIISACDYSHTYERQFCCCADNSAECALPSTPTTPTGTKLQRYLEKAEKIVLKLIKLARKSAKGTQDWQQVKFNAWVLEAAFTAFNETMEAHLNPPENRRLRDMVGDVDEEEDEVQESHAV